MLWGRHQNPPSGLSKAQTVLWHRVWSFGVDEYLPIRKFFYEDLRKTCKVAVDAAYRGDRLRRYRSPGKSPDPGNVLQIGELVRVDVVEPTVRGMRVVLWEFTRPRPRLLWSEDLQSCFAYPGLRRTACDRLPTPREARLHKTWNRGKAAECASVATFPAPRLGAGHPALAITYDSDKFNDSGRLDRYIHHHESGVLAHMGGKTAKNDPSAVMLRGGRLRLTKHGLEG